MSRIRIPHPNPHGNRHAETFTLEDLYTASAMTGMIAAQKREPRQEYVINWALEVGAKTAAEARKRRKRR